MAQTTKPRRAPASDSFGRNDLPPLRKVADRCHDWLFSNSGDTGDD